MPPQIYTLQLDNTALTSFFTVASHTNHAHQMNTVEQHTCETVWDFGEHLIDAIEENPDCTVEDVCRMALGYTDSYPLVDLPSDVVDEYLQALVTLQRHDSTRQHSPYQSALDTFRRNEETLGRQ